MLRRLLLLLASFLVISVPVRAEITGLFTFPEGTDGQVQFEKDGLFGGDSSLTFSTTTKLLTVATATVNNILDVGIGPVRNSTANITTTAGSFVAGTTYYYRIYPFTSGNKGGWPSPEMVQYITVTGSRVGASWDLLPGASYYRLTRGECSGCESGYFQTTNNFYDDNGGAFSGSGNAWTGTNNLLASFAGSLTLPGGTSIGWTDPITGNRTASFGSTSAQEFEWVPGPGRASGDYLFGSSQTTKLTWALNPNPAIMYWNQTPWEIRVATISFAMRDDVGTVIFNGKNSELLRITTDVVKLSNLNCSGNSNGGALTTTADGTITCSDDDNSGGGGGASTLEIFSNFDGTRSSPTASISVGDALKFSVSGSTGIMTVDFSSVASRGQVILNQNSLQSGSTAYPQYLYVGSSASVNGQLSVTSLKWPDGTIQVSSPTASAGGTPGGSTTQVQYNNGGSFAGDEGLKYDPVGKQFAFLSTTTSERAAFYFDTAGTGPTLTLGSLGISNPTYGFYFINSDTDTFSDHGAITIDGSTGYRLQLTQSSAGSGTNQTRYQVNRTGNSEIRDKNGDINFEIGHSSGTVYRTINNLSGVKTSTLTISSLNCSGNANGGTLTTDSSGNVVCADDDSGSGGASGALEVFSNFSGVRSSPTASIGMSNAFGGAVSGSSFTFTINSASITALGPNPPAASIASGALGSSVRASSVALNGFYSDANVRSNLGLAIGTNVQAYDADLDDLADGSLTGSKVGSGIPFANLAGGTNSNDQTFASTVTINGGLVLKGQPAQSYSTINTLYINPASANLYPRVIRLNGAIAFDQMMYSPANTDDIRFAQTSGTSVHDRMTINSSGVTISTVTGVKRLEFADGTTQTTAATGGGGGVSVSSFNYTFNPDQARSTSAITSPCAIQNSTSQFTSMLLCDASANEDAMWSTILSPYRGSTLKADIFWTMTSATSGSVVDTVQVYCSTGGATTRVDAVTWPGSNNGTLSVPGTAGYPTNSTITLSTTGGSCVDGALMMVRFSRNGGNASDDATGDQEVRKVRIYE